MRRRLRLATWDELPAAVKSPIDPRGLSVGIVHLGLGAFHRAHQAVYTDRAMSASGETGWGICAASQRTRAVLDALEPQDGLYTVVERGPSTSFTVRSALREVVFAREQQAALTARIGSASTHVVSLTVTEKGYRLDPTTRRLRVDDEIRADADGGAPVTVVGQLTRGLQQRMRGVGAPLTVLSCDNLPSNGEVTQHMVVDFCALLPHLESAPLVAWIAENVAFPSTMVDRIVPATTASDRAGVASTLDLDDAAAVVTEPFSQWVIEDAFAGPRPAWERAGAIFTDDVAPYEALKLRLLNGSHSALAYLGLLAGFETVAEFVVADGVADYVDHLMAETAATVQVPADFDLQLYKRELLSRFSDPCLQYRLEQIATDGSQKLPLRLLGALGDMRVAGSSARFTTLAVAGWMRFVSAGVDESGKPLPIDDPLSARIAAALGCAEGANDVVTRLLDIRGIFGDLGDDVSLRRDLVEVLESVIKGGALAAIRSTV